MALKEYKMPSLKDKLAEQEEERLRELKKAEEEKAKVAKKVNKKNK